MSDKFKTILADDTFAPRLPTGSRLLFQRGRKAKPGDIVAVSYTNDLNDFCIERYREGIAYFAVATRAALPKRKHETPNDDGEAAALDSLTKVDIDDDISTVWAEVLSAIGELSQKTSGVSLELESLKTMIAVLPESIETDSFCETLHLLALCQKVEAYCYKLIKVIKAEAERNARN